MIELSQLYADGVYDIYMCDTKRIVQTMNVIFHQPTDMQTSCSSACQHVNQWMLRTVALVATLPLTIQTMLLTLELLTSATICLHQFLTTLFP